MGKKSGYSRRAKILKRVLDWINSGSYSDFGRFMVFGNVSVSSGGEEGDPDWVILDLQDDLSETSETEEMKFWNEILKGISRIDGSFAQDRARQRVNERISVARDAAQGSAVDPLKAFMEKLSPGAKDVLRKAFSGGNKAASANVQEGNPIGDLSEPFDCHYSREVLEKLEKIVRRVSSLEKPIIHSESVEPSESVQEYFEEAHRCFLYGFSIATAVLCRAILEAQLNDLLPVLDPNGKLKAETEAGKRASYSKALIKSAAEKGLLEVEDGELLSSKWKKTHWAEDIVDAGNLAIHDWSKFKTLYGGNKTANIENILAVTRKAVIQLMANRSHKA